MNPRVNDNRPPAGGGTGRRSRPRYAPDAQVERAAELALKLGVALELTADGGVKIIGKLDSRPPALRDVDAEESPDDALADWEAKHGHPRNA